MESSAERHRPAYAAPDGALARRPTFLQRWHSSGVYQSALLQRLYSTEFTKAHKRTRKERGSVLHFSTPSLPFQALWLNLKDSDRSDPGEVLAWEEVKARILGSR